MGSVKAILHTSPWIPYNDTFYHSRMILTYPKNVIFTAQLLSHVQSLPIYDRFPNAERFNANLLQDVNWQEAMIVFDHDSRVVIAPDPVMELIQLDRRLQHREAAEAIFSPFQILPVELFRTQWFWILGLVLGWILVSILSNVVKHKPYRLVLSNKALKTPNHQ